MNEMKYEMKYEIATFGGGCFWCTEAIFQEINGVIAVKSGFSGGTVPGTPTYREVCSGITGHAEVVQVYFNPELISYIGAGFIIFILFFIYRVRKHLQQDNMSQRSKRFGK